MKKIEKLIILTIMNMILLCFVIVTLPDQVAIHIGPENQVDQMGSKYMLVVFALIPIILFG